MGPNKACQLTAREGMNKAVLALMQEEARRFNLMVGKSEAEAEKAAQGEEVRLEELRKENKNPYQDA